MKKVKKPMKKIDRGVPQQGVNSAGVVINYNRGRAWNELKPHKGGQK